LIRKELGSMPPVSRLGSPRAAPPHRPEDLTEPYRSMDKEVERRFLETLSRTLVSLPFDVKVLLEGVSDSDLEHDVRELAAATVVHIITPKDGNVEAYARHAEDVILLRLALRR